MIKFSKAYAVQVFTFGGLHSVEMKRARREFGSLVSAKRYAKAQAALGFTADVISAGGVAMTFHPWCAK